MSTSFRKICRTAMALALVASSLALSLVVPHPFFAQRRAVYRDRISMMVEADGSTKAAPERELTALSAEVQGLQDELIQARLAQAAAEEQVVQLRREIERTKSSGVFASQNASDFEETLLRLGDTYGEFAGAPVGEAAGAEEQVMSVFDTVDEDGNGVLDLDEFRRGYALLNGDAVARVFEAIDANGDGVLTKEEFRKGYDLLTSDSRLARSERQRVELAVADARANALKEAAMSLAEATLMDTLAGGDTAAKASKGSKYQPVPGRKPPSRAQRDAVKQKRRLRKETV